MNFERARASIVALEKRDEVTIIDALNVFHDLCEDISDSENASVETLPVGDADAVLMRLCWFGRTLLKVAEKNPEVISDAKNKQRLEQICAEVNAISLQLEKSQERVKVFDEHLKNVSEQKLQVEAKIKSQMEAIENVKTSKSQLDDKYNALTVQLQQLNKEQRSLVESIENLEASMKQTDVASLQEIFEVRSRELKERQEEHQILNEKITDQEELLEHLKKDYDEKCKYLQEVTWNTENEIKNCEKALQELQERMSGAQNKKRSLMYDIDQKESELKTLEQWFSSLEAKDYESRMSNYKARIKALQEARDALIAQLSLLYNIAPEQGMQSLANYQKFYRDALDNIDKSLNRYQECYRIVTGALSQGGSHL